MATAMTATGDHCRSMLGNAAQPISAGPGGIKQRHMPVHKSCALAAADANQHG